MGGKSKSKQSSSSQNVNSNQGINSGIGLNYGVNQSGNFGFNQATGGSNNFGFNQGLSESTGGSSNFGSSQSTGTSFNQSDQDVWGQQSPYLQDVYQQAQNAFGQGMSQINGLTPEVQAQVQGAFDQATGGYGNQLGGGFAAGLQGQVGPNSYVDAMRGQVADDAQLLKQQNLGSLDARAAAAGMSGSSGYRDQVGRMMNDVDENAMNQMAQIGYNSFDRGVQNQMNLANMMDQNQQFGTSNLQNLQQGAMNQFNPAMAGMNMAGQYGQIIGGPTVLGSSMGGSMNNSSSMNQGSSFNNSTSNNFGMNTGNSFNNSMGMNTGFSNGMNVGMNMNGGFNNGYGYGANNGSGSSSGWSFDPGAAMQGAGAMGYSDARLKRNIEHVDSVDGVNLYTWDWKDSAMSSPMNYGVIAQEVAETHPEAVMTGDHGYLMVDYSKLGRAGEMALARMEG